MFFVVNAFASYLLRLQTDNFGEHALDVAHVTRLGHL